MSHLATFSFADISGARMEQLWMDGFMRPQHSTTLLRNSPVHGLPGLLASQSGGVLCLNAALGIFKGSLLLRIHSPGKNTF